MASAPTATCPTCHAPVDPMAKFCPACGASLTGPPSPPPPPPSPAGRPVDIRQSVDQDRGVLKRLQLLIPGFHGYRVGEDLREADSLLRLQVADRLKASIQTVQDCRTALTQANQFQGLTDLAPVLADLQRLEGEIRHAEQGYTGISPATRMTPDRINQLYEYDYGFVSAADQVGQSLSPLRSVAGSSNGVAITAAIQTVQGQIGQLEQAFQARIRVVEGIQV